MSAHGYRIIEKMASGSFGVVFKVVRQRDGALFVMKRIPLLGLSSKQRHEAAQEIFLMSEVRHPFIVAQRDAFLFNENDLCIIMDFYDGGDMDALLIAQRELDRYFSLEQVMLWFVQMLLAVHYLHEHGILHRDIKTHNIFIDAKNHSLAVGDFGVAERIHGAEAAGPSRSVSATTASQGIRAKPASQPAAVPAKTDDASLRSALVVTSLQQHPCSSSAPHAAAESEEHTPPQQQPQPTTLTCMNNTAMAEPTPHGASELSAIAPPTTSHTDYIPRDDTVQQPAVEADGSSPYPNDTAIDTTPPVAVVAAAARKKAGPIIRGTPMYMSPEQLQGCPSGQKADVWSLGCILYELLTLRHPFETRDMAALIIRVIRGEREPLPGHYPAVIADLVNNLLRVDAAQRPTCAEVLQMPCVRAYLTVLVRVRVPTTAVSERSLRAQLAALHSGRHATPPSQASEGVWCSSSSSQSPPVHGSAVPRRRSSVRGGGATAIAPQLLALAHEQAPPPPPLPMPTKAERGARRSSLVAVSASTASARRTLSVGNSFSSMHSSSGGGGGPIMHRSSSSSSHNHGRAGTGRQSSFRRSSVTAHTAAAAPAAECGSASSDGGECEGGGILSAAMIERELHTPPHAPSVERARITRRCSVAGQEVVQAMRQLAEDDERVPHTEAHDEESATRRNVCDGTSETNECASSGQVDAKQVGGGGDDVIVSDALAGSNESSRSHEKEEEQTRKSMTNTNATTTPLPPLIDVPLSTPPVPTARRAASSRRHVPAHSAQSLMELYGDANSTFFGDAPYVMDETLTTAAPPSARSGDDDKIMQQEQQQYLQHINGRDEKKSRLYRMHSSSSSSDDTIGAGLDNELVHDDAAFLVDQDRNKRACSDRRYTPLSNTHLSRNDTCTAEKASLRVRSGTGGGGSSRSRRSSGDDASAAADAHRLCVHAESEQKSNGTCAEDVVWCGEDAGEHGRAAMDSWVAGMLETMACDNVEDMKDAPVEVIYATVIAMRRTLQEMTRQQQRLHTTSEVVAEGDDRRRGEADSPAPPPVMRGNSDNDRTHTHTHVNGTEASSAYAQRRGALWREIRSTLSRETAETVLAYYRTHSILERDIRVVQQLVPQSSHWHVLPLVADVVVLDRLVHPHVTE